MYQGQNTQVVVKLLDPSGTSPATGLLYTDLTFEYWISGETSLQENTMQIGDLVEIGNGNYILKVPGFLLSKVGYFFIRLSGLLSQEYEQQFLVQPVTPSFNNNPSICVVSGNIIDITGSPASAGEAIEFRIVSVPKVVGQSFVNVQRIVTHPDAYGSFSVQLVRGADVAVDIKRAGINYQFTVPNQETALLLDLLPPL